MTRFIMFVCAFCVMGFMPPAEAQDGSATTGSFLAEQDITWKVNTFEVARWKTLVGGIEGGQIDDPDIQFGLWELAPHGIYHGHKHDAPEIYYILSGRAQWQVGDSVQELSRGSTIYTKPGEVHKMTNLSDQAVQAIWVWWAPNGDREVFRGEYQFTEPTPKQPADLVPWQKSQLEKLYPES